jgi:hypothetical protein
MVRAQKDRFETIPIGELREILGSERLFPRKIHEQLPLIIEDNSPSSRSSSRCPHQPSLSVEQSRKTNVILMALNISRLGKESVNTIFTILVFRERGRTLSKAILMFETESKTFYFRNSHAF